MLREHRLHLGGDRRYLKLSWGSAHPEAACNTNKYAARRAVYIRYLLALSQQPARLQRRARQAHNIMHRWYCAACL